MAQFGMSNQFWKNRTKHGKDKLYMDRAVLKEACMEYFQWCDDNPVPNAELLKSGDWAGTLAEAPLRRPYLLSGLLIHLGVSDQWWLNLRKDTTKDADYLGVVIWADRVIETQQLEGALVGHFNPRIIAAKQGINEKTEIINKNVDMNKLADLTDDEIKRIGKSLEDGI
jgi:hypothetical protein